MSLFNVDKTFARITNHTIQRNFSPSFSLYKVASVLKKVTQTLCLISWWKRGASEIILIQSVMLPWQPDFLLQDLLASHFRTDWLSWLGLGNQVGSTTDHITNCYLPSTLKDWSVMRAELTGIIANRGWGKCNLTASSKGFLPSTCAWDRKDVQKRLDVWLHNLP